MISVVFEENKEAKALTLTIKGHSGQAEIGKDIVCASASMLAYTVAQYMKFMYEQHKLKKKPVLDLEYGDTRITVKPKTDDYAEALHTFFVAQVGFNLLASNYPQYVEVKMFDEA